MLEQLEKSPNDKRIYKPLKLDNGLKVLLVHDNEIEKSACAISVNVGSLADPDSSLGLAHFLEHMLFMGSAKYPGQNEYSSFISLNAGLDNAYTSDTETNYFFEIATDKFSEAVDRLSQFFSSALLNADSIQKERQAVHEEYMRWVNDDNCKKWGVIHELGNGNYHRFSIGNQQTLNHPKIRDELVEFYNKYYSSNIINAVLSSNLPIEEMEKMLDGLKKIPNKQVVPPTFDVPYLPSQLGKHVKIQSIKDEYILEYIWIVDSLKHLYKKHVDQYLTQILGHEGQNSLFRILKNRGWISSLNSWNHNIIHKTMIAIQLKLTEDGRQQIIQIQNIIFNYLRGLKAEQYIYEEVKQKNKLAFIFQQKYSNSSYVCKLASLLHYIPMENILNYKVLNDPFDSEYLNHIMSQLSPQNLLLFDSSNSKIEDRFEKYLKTNYSVQQLHPPAKMQKQFPSLMANPFLPVDLTIYPSSQNIPRNIADNVVFLQDYKFKIAKGGIRIDFYNQMDRLYRQLYSEWLEQMLKPYTYPAEVLDVKIEYKHAKCLGISLFGYNDAVLKLVDIIGNHILQLHQNLEEGENAYNICLEKVIEEYENFYLNASDDIADEFEEMLLEGNQLETIEDIIDLLKSYTFSKFIETAVDAWKKTLFEWIVVGNFVPEKIIERVKAFESTIHPQQTPKINEVPILKINRNIIFAKTIDCEDLTTSCTIVDYESGPYSLRLKIMLEIIKLYIAEPYFDQLRTKRQLAYYLRASVRANRGILGLKFILQSSNTNAGQVGILMKEFIMGFFAKFQSISTEQLQKLKTAVLNRLTQPFNSLKELNSFIVQEVKDRTYDFSRKEKAVVQGLLNTITRQQLWKVIQQTLIFSLDIYIVAHCHLKEYEAHGVKSEDYKHIKQKCEYHREQCHYDHRRSLK